MIDFADKAIASDLTDKDGGPTFFETGRNTVENGYSLILQLEEGGETFEVILAYQDLREMIKAIDEKLNKRGNKYD